MMSYYISISWSFFFWFDGIHLTRRYEKHFWRRLKWEAPFSLFDASTNQQKKSKHSHRACILHIHDVFFPHFPFSLFFRCSLWWSLYVVNVAFNSLWSVDILHDAFLVSNFQLNWSWIRNANEWLRKYHVSKCTHQRISNCWINEEAIVAESFERIYW